MIHDQDLVDRLAELRAATFDGEVFRATRIGADPTKPSISGGRWALPPEGDSGARVLYTSFERNGAIAEVVSFLAELTPIPGPRPIKITRLHVSTARTMCLARADLPTLGVDLDRYGERDYALTQKIGAALVFLDFDGLIAPSARWPCDNLMIFGGNHALAERLEPIDEEQIEWRAWADAHGVIPD